MFQNFISAVFLRYFDIYVILILAHMGKEDINDKKSFSSSENLSSIQDYLNKNKNIVYQFMKRSMTRMKKDYDNREDINFIIYNDDNLNKANEKEESISNLSLEKSSLENESENKSVINQLG